MSRVVAAELALQHQPAQLAVLLLDGGDHLRHATGVPAAAAR